MYKNRIINRVNNNNNSNFSQDVGRMNKYDQYHDYYDLEDFVNDTTSNGKCFGRIKGNRNNNSNCGQVNKWSDCDGTSIKNAFIFIGNVDFPSLGHGANNTRALEIKVDKERNIFVNGKKMDVENSEDGAKIFTIYSNCKDDDANENDKCIIHDEIEHKKNNEKKDKKENVKDILIDKVEPKKNNEKKTNKKNGTDETIIKNSNEENNRDNDEKTKEKKLIDDNKEKKDK